MGVGSEADLGVESSVRRAIGRSRRDRNDGCYHSPPSNSVCSLDKNETGKNVQICQKTEKVLRRCAGRYRFKSRKSRINFFFGTCGSSECSPCFRS